MYRIDFRQGRPALERPEPGEGSSILDTLLRFEYRTEPSDFENNVEEQRERTRRERKSETENRAQDEANEKKNGEASTVSSRDLILPCDGLQPGCTLH